MRHLSRTLSPFLFALLACFPAAQTETLDQCLNAVSEEKDDAIFAMCRPVAEQGNAEVQLMMGSFYLEGRGVAKDEQEAYVWMLMAAAQEVLFAQQLADVVKELLSASQIAAAEKEAKRRLARTR